MATDDPIIGGCYLTISADKTEIIEGDDVQFTIELFGGCSRSISVDIFINNIFVDSQYFPNDDSLLYTHTFNESGEFTVSVDTGAGSTIRSDSIDITVEEATIESSTPQVSWGINNKNVQSIEINNKEVKSIITSNGQVLYNKEKNVLELQFTGSDFSINSKTPFTYTGNVFVDWGDNSGLIEYTSGQLSHSFVDGATTHTIKIYGDITSLGASCFDNCSGLISVEIPDSVTSLGASCFNNCSGLISVEIPDSVTSLGGYCFCDCSSLTSINIPDSVTSLKVNCFFGCFNLISLNIPSNVTSLGDNCFYDCTGLISLQLNWIGNDILTYKSNWVRNTSTSLKFIIPFGTTQLYIDKGYPSDKLVENIITINLTGNKSVLSYTDNDTVTLSAEVLDWNNQPMQNITVNFYQKIGTSLLTRSYYMGSSDTNSDGIATYSYDSMGYGDVFFRAMIQNNQEEVIGQSTEYSVEDCWQVIPTGNRTGFNSNLAPTPLIITGTTKKDGSWGGTRFYGKDNGTNAINYVYLSQNFNNSSENEKIRYNLSTIAETFKITISDGTVELYINDVLQNSVNCNTTYPLQISGGSSANPVNITNIKVKAYQVR